MKKHVGFHCLVFSHTHWHIENTCALTLLNDLLFQVKDVRKSLPTNVVLQNLDGLLTLRKEPTVKK